MRLAAHKDYNSTWYYTSSKNPLRPHWNVNETVMFAMQSKELDSVFVERA